MPAPPASASSANTSRTRVTSTARACAIPAQTPAITRSSARGAKTGSGIRPHRTARATRTDPTLACASRISTRAPVSSTLLSTLRPSSVSPSRSTAPSRTSARTRTAASRGTTTLQVADVHACAHPRLADGQPDVAQVDPQLPHAERIAPVEIADAGRRVRALADAVAEVNREDGDEDRHRDEHEGEERAEPRSRSPCRAGGRASSPARRGPRSRRRCRPRRGGLSAAGFAGCSDGRWCVSQRIAPPARRSRIQAASPCGHTVARERSTTRATARSPSPISGHGRSPRSRSAPETTESSLPSSGMTSAAAR